MIGPTLPVLLLALWATFGLGSKFAEHPGKVASGLVIVKRVYGISSLKCTVSCIIKATQCQYLRKKKIGSSKVICEFLKFNDGTLSAVDYLETDTNSEYVTKVEDVKIDPFPVKTTVAPTTTEATTTTEISTTTEIITTITALITTTTQQPAASAITTTEAPATTTTAAATTQQSTTTATTTTAAPIIYTFQTSNVAYTDCLLTCGGAGLVIAKINPSNPPQGYLTEYLKDTSDKHWIECTSITDHAGCSCASHQGITFRWNEATSTPTLACKNQIRTNICVCMTP